MPRAPRNPQSSPEPVRALRELILVAEAARRCGWKRPNTFRERFLATEEEASAMGLAYDEHGRAVVDARAVEAAVAKVQSERASRDPGWRLKNLGRYARTRPTTQLSVRAERHRRNSRKDPQS